MNLDGMTIDRHVAFDQGKVNVESFGISCQRSCQIDRSDIGQASLSSFARLSGVELLQCNVLAARFFVYPRLQMIAVDTPED